MAQHLNTDGTNLMTGTLQFNVPYDYASIELCGNVGGYIDFKSDFTRDFDGRIIYNNNNSGSFDIYGTTNFKNDLIVVGNVLIGKGEQANTSYKLDVAGKIRSNEIVVNTTGADFVFDPDYSLPELEFVVQFIKENRRLPEMPSAAIMQKEGMAVGELNTKLLQKVEELTLYLIQQHEINRVQAKELKTQSNEIKALKQLVLKQMEIKN